MPSGFLCWLSSLCISLSFSVCVNTCVQDFVYAHEYESQNATSSVFLENCPFFFFRDGVPRGVLGFADQAVPTPVLGLQVCTNYHTTMSHLAMGDEL